MVDKMSEQEEVKLEGDEKEVTKVKKYWLKDLYWVLELIGTIALLLLGFIVLKLILGI